MTNVWKVAKRVAKFYGWTYANEIELAEKFENYLTMLITYEV